MRTFSSAAQERELETKESPDKASVSIDPKEIPKPSKYSFHDNRFSEGKKVLSSKKIGKKELKMDQKWEHDKFALPEKDKFNDQEKKSINLKINIIKKDRENFKKPKEDLKIRITKYPKPTIKTEVSSDLPPLPINLPQMMPQMMPQMVPQMMPQMIPQMMPQMAPQMMPQMIPQMMPQMISPTESNFMYSPYMTSSGQLLFMTETGLFVPSPIGYYPTYVSPVRSKAIPIVKPCD